MSVWFGWTTAAVFQATNWRGLYIISLQIASLRLVLGLIHHRTTAVGLHNNVGCAQNEQYTVIRSAQ